MEIELLEPGRMKQTGSSLLRLIQNNNMPVLDLLVRESIQNSLDAAKDSADCVNVRFIKGRFKSDAFANELSGITSTLNQRFRESRYDYLAVQDSNTQGLTGPLNYSQIRDGQYGNLLKLVYEICKPQEQEGAGGSWGLGKTVYFRVGIGIVVYYSRICEEGEFRSRLAATLVEDEKATNTILPRNDRDLNSGIAWWGHEIGENSTEPLTDENEIRRILAIFGLVPYEQEQTGTTIIIPYIDETRLLQNNAIQYTDANDQTIEPYWRKSIEEYLRVAVQRWYCPRLNNRLYPYGKYLHAYINNTPISKSDMEPLFRIVGTLYNRANGYEEEFAFPIDSDATGIDDIRLNGIFVDPKAGSLAYVKVSRENLRMVAPDNKQEPYLYINDEMRSANLNAPIVCFVRKPGMVVSYEITGTWVNGIPQTDPEHYIIAIFVLNSLQTIKGQADHAELTLEEYVRKCEMADHTSWRDSSLGTRNPRIVAKVQKHVISRLTEKFDETKELTDRQQNSGLGKLFGDLLLPPQNFGKRPSPAGSKSNTGGRAVGRQRSVSLYSVDNSVRYGKNSLQLALRLSAGSRFSSAETLLGIGSEGGTITPTVWKMQMGLRMPFTIKKATITYEATKQDTGVEQEQTLDCDHAVAAGSIFASEIIMLDGDGIGISIKGDGQHMLNATIHLDLALVSRKEQAVLYLGETREAEA